MALQFQYLCLVLLVSFVAVAENKPSYIERIKQAILSEINRNPGTRIMPTHELLADTCIAKPFNQTIHYKNCIPKTIENKFCYGQCNSFYIPSMTGKPMVTCFRCQPALMYGEDITLECVKNNRLRRKEIRVQKIVSCRCAQCKPH